MPEIPKMPEMPEMPEEFWGLWLTPVFLKKPMEVAGEIIPRDKQLYIVSPAAPDGSSWNVCYEDDFDPKFVVDTANLRFESRLAKMSFKKFMTLDPDEIEGLCSLYC
jgi:hypothetical protein